MNKRNLEANQGEQKGSLRHQAEAGLKRKMRREIGKKLGKNYFANTMATSVAGEKNDNTRYKTNC